MASCPRCLELIDGEPGYCGVCGRPRIVESLRLEKGTPLWLRTAWKSLIWLTLFWFLITVGVAFIREARAVRLSRQLLAENKAQEAWELLSPFLPDHPHHLQGLFLCGKATVRLGLKSEAKQCLTGVSGISEGFAKELTDDYQKVLAEKGRTGGCDVQNFAQLLGWKQELGAPFETSLVAALERVVEDCRAGRRYYDLQNIRGMLAQARVELPSFKNTPA